jgi:hypothetical protein
MYVSSKDFTGITQIDIHKKTGTLRVLTPPPTRGVAKEIKKSFEEEKYPLPPHWERRAVYCNQAISITVYV